MEKMVAGEKERKAQQPRRAREKLLRTKRYQTLHKKAEELEKLCDAKVCVVSYDSDGKCDVWPKDEAKARATIMEYKKASLKKTKHVKNSGFLGRKKTKPGQENKSFDEKFSLVDKLSGDSLMGLSAFLERKIQELNERIDNANYANNVGSRIEAFEEDNNELNCTNYGPNGGNYLDYDRAYEYLLGDYNEISDYNNVPPMVSYNFNEKDCESADKLVENLMGFNQSSAENSNVNNITNQALRPVGCCSWSNQNQLQRETDVSSMYLEQNHQGLVDHDVHRHPQQQLSPLQEAMMLPQLSPLQEAMVLPQLSPLQEAMMLPSSWWLQPNQTQMTNNGNYSLTPWPTALHNCLN